MSLVVSVHYTLNDHPVTEEFQTQTNCFIFSINKISIISSLDLYVYYLLLYMNPRTGCFI